MDIEASNLEEIEDIDTDDDSEPKVCYGIGYCFIFLVIPFFVISMLCVVSNYPML